MTPCTSGAWLARRTLSTPSPACRTRWLARWVTLWCVAAGHSRPAWQQTLTSPQLLCSAASDVCSVAHQSAEEPFSTSPCPALLQLADLGFSSENGFQPNEASDLALEALSHAPAIAAQLIEAR